MRHLVAIRVIGLLAAWALSIEGNSVNGAQPPRPEPATPPSTENAPEHTPPLSSQLPAAPGPNAFRRGEHPRFVPGP